MPCPLVCVRPSENSGVNPERGGTLLATRVSGWDANHFFALEPPNGGGTPCVKPVTYQGSVAPFRGLLSPAGARSTGLRRVAIGVPPLTGLLTMLCDFVSVLLSVRQTGH